MTGLGMETLRPGDIGFGPIDNSLPRWLPPWARFVPGTFPVDMGQLLLAGTKRVERDIDHVYVVTSAGPRPTIVQAMPSGAEEIEIGPEHWTNRYVYVRPQYEIRSMEDVYGGEWDQASAVAAAAENYIGTPYSFLDYAAIALHHIDPVWHIAPEATNSQPLSRYIRDTGHMICSQHVDQSLTDAGFHVFTDGRLPQDVMPIELYRKLTSMQGTLVLRPGMYAWYPEAS